MLFLKIENGVITKEDLQVDPSKVKNVNDWMRPETVIEIESFLKVRYYRRFIKKFSRIAAH